MVNNYPDLMANIKESELRPHLNKRLQSIVIGDKSDRDQDGRHIFIFRAGIAINQFYLLVIFYNYLRLKGRWNPEETTLDDVFRCNLYCLKRLAAEPDAQLNGIVCLVDLQDLGLYQARHFTPGYAKKVADLVTVSHFSFR